MTKKRTSRKTIKFFKPVAWPDIDHILDFIAITDPVTTYDMVDINESPHRLGYTLPGFITYPRAQEQGVSITWRKDPDSIVDDYKREKVATTRLYSFLKNHYAYKREWSVFKKKKKSNRPNNLFLHPCSEITFMHAVALGMREYVSEKKPLATADQHSNITKSFRRIFDVAKRYDLFNSKDETDKFWSTFGDLGVQFHVYKSVGKNNSYRREFDALSVIAKCFYERFGQTVPKAVGELAELLRKYRPSPVSVERYCARIEKESNKEAHLMMIARIGESFVSPYGGMTLGSFMKTKLGTS